MTKDVLTDAANHACRVVHLLSVLLDDPNVSDSLRLPRTELLLAREHARGTLTVLGDAMDRVSREKRLVPAAT